MGRLGRENSIRGCSRQSLVWTVLFLFVMTWAGIVATCCADGDDQWNGDPASLPPTCQTVTTMDMSPELMDESLDPTAGTLGDFWMILMAMAYQLAL